MDDTGKRKPKAKGNGEGTVRAVGKRWRWEITLGYQADGKRISRSGYEDTKTRALATMRAAQTDHGRGLLAAPEKVTVREYAERWKRRLLEIRPRTAKRYGEELDYALKHIGDLRMQAIRPHHLKELMVTLSKRPMRRGNLMSPRTQAHIMTRLRSLFREAVSDLIIYVNPVDGVKRVRGGRLASAGEALDFEQAARFREVGTALHAAGLCRLWPAAFMALTTGMRRGEIMALTWEDLDLDTSTIQVRRARVMGEDAIEMGPPKTANSCREINIPPSLKPVLQRHRAAQQRERREAGEAWLNSGAVFATTLGDWTHPDNLTRAVEKIVQWSDPETLKRTQDDPYIWRGIAHEKREALMAVTRAGARLPAVSPHDLRHSYATLALRSGADIARVSRDLGHARVSITLDIYRHVSDEEKRSNTFDLFADEAPEEDE